jgi:hydroxymethylglutaryl-CoA lyase
VSDTIGIAHPGQVRRVLDELLKEVPSKQIALHFHDTRGMALANVYASLEYGITTFDSSAGGIGGCPYAPGAAGNLATEDAVFMFHGMGVETGINLDRLVEAGELAQQLIGRKLAGKYLQAALGEREKRARRALAQGMPR